VVRLTHTKAAYEATKRQGSGGEREEETPAVGLYAATPLASRVTAGRGRRW